MIQYFKTEAYGTDRAIGDVAYVKHDTHAKLRRQRSKMRHEMNDFALAKNDALEWPCALATEPGILFFGNLLFLLRRPVLWEPRVNGRSKRIVSRVAMHGQANATTLTTRSPPESLHGSKRDSVHKFTKFMMPIWYAYEVLARGYTLSWGGRLAPHDTGQLSVQIQVNHITTC